MLKFLKKVFFNESLSRGFSLVELVIGILIIMLIGGAMMEGTSYYRNKMLSINIREKAYSELKNFTTYWKSRIAANEWQIDEDENWRSGGEVELFTSITPDSDDKESIKGQLSYRAEKIIKHSNEYYYFYRLETKLAWQILSTKDSLSFLIDQIVF